MATILSFVLTCVLVYATWRSGGLLLKFIGNIFDNIESRIS